MWWTEFKFARINIYLIGFASFYDKIYVSNKMCPYEQKICNRVFKKKVDINTLLE